MGGPITFEHVNALWDALGERLGVDEKMKKAVNEEVEK